MYSEKTHKVIYSKRFPRQNIDEPPKDREVPEERLPTKPLVSSRAYLNRIAKNSTYLPNPDKIANQEKFVNLAITLSETYKIDMEITDCSHYISVTMYLDCAYCTGELKALFTELIVMCDSISSFLSGSDPCDFILSLDYYTHDHYISGKMYNSPLCP